MAVTSALVSNSIRCLRLAALCVALLLTACGSLLSQAGSATDHPQQGGALTYALSFEAGNMSPISGASYDAHLIFRNVYDTLVFLDPSGNFQPDLARSWELSPDGLSYTFKLRDGVTFQDGTPFNADAVKFTFDTVADPATKSLTARDLLGPSYKSTTIVDQLTVKVTFDRPYLPFLSAISQSWLAPVSPTAYKKWGTDYPLHQVGTGPFLWKEYIPKDHVTLVRNAAYNWPPSGAGHSGPAYLDSIVFRFVSENSVRTGALQTGEIQLAEDLPPKDVAALKGDPKMTVLGAQLPGLATVLFLNTQREPTSSLEFRQALNYAVDKDALNKLMFNSLATTAGTALAPNTLHYNKSSELYKFDPAKAKALLDQAGWTAGPDGVRQKDGVKASLSLNTLPFNRYPETFQVVQAQLKDVGVGLQINVMTFAQSTAAAQKSDYNLMPLFVPSFDPYVLGTYFQSRNIGQGFAYSRYQNPRLDQLLDAGLSETDPAKRADLYGQAQQLIMQQALVLPLYNVTNNSVARAELKGVMMDRLGWDPLLYDAYLQKK